ncbi:hypothetical protein D3C77_622040 [compost metagenome]
MIDQHRLRDLPEVRIGLSHRLGMLGQGKAQQGVMQHVVSAVHAAGLATQAQQQVVVRPAQVDTLPIQRRAPGNCRGGKGKGHGRLLCDTTGLAAYGA